jgi:putative alpha-1,2-mannosidase
MSAWYIFNAMGFYPVNPASAEYIIGTPYFDKMEVKFPQSDKILTISGNNAKDNMYVQGLVINGVSVTSPVLKHADLLTAESMVFSLSTSPQTWGLNTV